VTELDVVPKAPGCWNRIGVTGDRSCPELRAYTHCRNCPVFAAGGQRLLDRPPPPGYADEWAERIAAADPPPPADTLPVVLFRVGPEWLALDVADTVEVAPARPIRRVPHQSDRVLAGLVNIRGELQLAVDLKHLLGTGDADEPGTGRLLVAERGGVRWVFLTDAVDDIRHLPAADLGRVPATVAAGPAAFTRGVFRWRDRAVGYLDADRLFAALERSFR
jgi:chemotaxis-related protein WspD